MKKKLYLCALLPALLFASSCSVEDLMFWKKNDMDTQEKQSVNVIILSGQSNAAGCKASTNLIKSMGQDAYDKYNAGFDDVKIAFANYTVSDYNKDPHPMELQNSSKGEFVKVKLGQGNVATNFGPEVGMAEELYEKWGNKFYIIKIPSGGSNLNDDWADSNEYMFKQLVSFVDARMSDLKSKNLNPVLRAFCWMQGEGDAYDRYWQHYYDNLIRFKTNLDKVLLKYTEDNNLPFVDAGIGPGTAEGETTGGWDYYKEVNDCKKDFAKLKETNIYIDTIEAGLHSNKEPNDNVHYDSESQIQLGHLFAKNFEKFFK